MIYLIIGNNWLVLSSAEYAMNEDLVGLKLLLEDRSNTSTSEEEISQTMIWQKGYYYRSNLQTGLNVLMEKRLFEVSVFVEYAMEISYLLK